MTEKITRGTKDLGITMTKEQWNVLKPVYFQKWVWQKAVKHEPSKYSNNLPFYQGRKVILT